MTRYLHTDNPFIPSFILLKNLKLQLVHVGELFLGSCQVFLMCTLETNFIKKKKEREKKPVAQRSLLFTYWKI